MLAIKQETIWCPLHWEIAMKRGVNIPNASFAILEEAFKKPEVRGLVSGQIQKGFSEQEAIEYAEREFLKYKPFCCFIGREFVLILNAFATKKIEYDG